MRKKEGDDKNIKNKKGMTYWDIFIFGKKKKKYKKRKTEKKIRRKKTEITIKREKIRKNKKKKKAIMKK